MNTKDVKPCQQGERSMSVISDDGAIIMFLPCGVISFNRNDVARRYCGHCHRFIDVNLDGLGSSNARASR